MNRIHILNGDALADRFPDEIQGERIIFRECLIDGPCDSSTMDELFKARSEYLAHTEEDLKFYSEKVEPPIRRLQELKNQDITLWFEEDLFCQINAWFIITCLENSNAIFRVQLDPKFPYSFGHHTNDQLVSLFESRKKLESLNHKYLSDLWLAFAKKEKFDTLQKKVFEDFNDRKSHKARQLLHELLLPFDESPLKTKMQKATVSTDSFVAFFQKFSQLYPEYGLGDQTLLRYWRILEVK